MILIMYLFSEFSGVYFKWMTLDSVLISKDGRLILSGLDGCVLARCGGNEPASSRQSHGRDSRPTHKPAVPTAMLSTSSPETVLGAPASKHSSSFIAAVACVYILTGKSLFKVYKDIIIDYYPVDFAKISPHL